jgi:hypothetical protein
VFVRARGVPLDLALQFAQCGIQPAERDIGDHLVDPHEAGQVHFLVVERHRDLIAARPHEHAAAQRCFVAVGAHGDDVAGAEAMRWQSIAAAGAQHRVQAAAEAGLEVDDLEPQQRGAARLQLRIAACTQQPFGFRDLGLPLELQQTQMFTG